jgi:hypothetical protein
MDVERTVTLMSYIMVLQISSILLVPLLLRTKVYISIPLLQHFYKNPLPNTVDFIMRQNN